MGLLDRFRWKRQSADDPPEVAEREPRESVEPKSPPDVQDEEPVVLLDRNQSIERIVLLLEGGQLNKAARAAGVDEWGKSGLKAAFEDLPRIFQSVPGDELPAVRVAGGAMYLLGLRHPPSTFGRHRMVGPRFSFEIAARMIRSLALLSREVAACRALGFKRATVYGRGECCLECQAIPSVISVDDARQLLHQTCTGPEGCVCWISPELE
jgi:hypothetical protein